MSYDQAPLEPPPQTAPRTGPSRTTITVLVAAVAVLALGIGALAGVWLAGRGTPGETSAEAGFARDMQTHHAQAVEMAMVVRDKTSDPTIRTLAYDIATSQQQQIGRMYAWLVDWGLPQTSSQPPMAWMSGANGHGGMGSGPASATTTPAPGSGMDMPGMASPGDLQRLTALSGVEAERLFLQLMITHHEGGVTMAQAALNQADDPQVRTLATAIVTGQQSEIDLMRQLLANR